MLYEGRHAGYAGAGLQLSRTISIGPDALRIRDAADVARDDVPVVWRFHLSDDVAATIEGTTAVLRSPAARAVLRWEPSLRVSVEAGWYSPSYGVRRASQQVVCRGACPPGRSEWAFVMTVATASSPD